MRKTLLILIFVLATIFLFQNKLVKAESQWLRTDGRSIVDDGGNVVILRGANFMGQEFGSVKYRNESDYEKMASWGFNVVRLPIAWRYVEPMKGVYDESFLQKIDEEIGWAKKYGLYIVLDMHQNKWSPHFTYCRGAGGNGIPEWAISAYDNTQEGMAKAKEDFWNKLGANGSAVSDSNPSLWQRFADMWKYVAARYANEPAIAAYDIFNEPTRSAENKTCNDNDPSLSYITVEKFKSMMYDFQTDVIDNIREVDTKHIIFVNSYSHAGDLLEVKIDRQNIVLGTHMYCGAEIVDPTKISKCVNTLVTASKSYNSPALVGEFSPNPFDAEWTKEALRQFDANSLGYTWWTYWKDDKNQRAPLYSNGTEKREIIELLNRPYPQLSSTAINNFSFDTQNRIFKISLNDTVAGSQIIQTYSPQKPKKILISGAEIAEVASLSELKDNSWYYDQGGKKLHLMLFVIPPVNPPPATQVQHVYGDRIFDENGKEVVWRSAGVNYLFGTNANTDNYKLEWQNHLPKIKAMGLNTIRLAFSFADSTPDEKGALQSDILDFDKLEWVLNFLAENGVKAILDCHDYDDMYGDLGSQKLIDDWVNVAKRYQGDSRIAAYELFNEPSKKTWGSSVQSNEDVARAYAELTQAVRAVDPDHIVIWYGPYSNVFPPLENITQYLQSNVVYGVRRLWLQNSEEFDIWTPEQISFKRLDYYIQMREKFNVPIWLGEFGAHSILKILNSSNTQWLVAEQYLWRGEEQAVGWSLWCNFEYQWSGYLPFFPLKTYNPDFTRKPWQNPLPKLTDYLVDQNHVDVLEPYDLYQLKMWHKKDYVTFRPGIVILVVTEHKLLNGSLETVSREEIQITTQLTIRNEEGTPAHPGDWNTMIYSLRQA